MIPNRKQPKRGSDLGEMNNPSNLRPDHKSSTAARLLQEVIRKECENSDQEILTLTKPNQSSGAQLLEDKVIKTHQEMLREIRGNLDARKTLLPEPEPHNGGNE